MPAIGITLRDQGGSPGEILFGQRRVCGSALKSVLKLSSAEPAEARCSLMFSYGLGG